MITKILSVATLIVASTALANAATVLYDYSSATDKNLSSNGWTYVGDSSTGANYYGAGDAGTFSWSTKSSVGKRDAWRLTDGTTTKNTSAYVSISDKEGFSSGNFTVTLNMQLDSSCYYSDGTNGSSDYFNKSGNYTKEGFSITVGDGEKIYTAKFGNNNGTITVNGSDVSSMKWDTLTDVVITVDKSKGQATFAVGESSVSLTGTSSSETYVSAVRIGTIDAENKDEGTACFSRITIAAVPEPSAFGLLAGLGAIALAVSRRSRSR